MTVTVRTSWYGSVRGAQAEAGAQRGVAKAVEHLLGEARKIAPLEEGPLRRSGVASVDGLQGAVSFSQKYAVEQHENLTYRHDPGQTAKYLEGPYDRELPTMLAMVAAEIRRALR